MRNNRQKTTVRHSILRLLLLVLEAVIGVSILFFTVYVADPHNGFTQVEFWLALALFGALPLWMLLVGCTLWWFTQPPEEKEPMMPSASGEEW